MSAPQTPPPCPDWCVSAHPDGSLLLRFHLGPELHPGPLASVKVEQDDGEQPHISLVACSAVINLTSHQALGLSNLVTDPVAVALRKAADELDRIGGAS